MIKDKKKKKKCLRSPVARSKIKQVISEIELQCDKFKREPFCRELVLPLSKTTEKAMAPHSSTLAWKIPWTEEPGRLQSMGSLIVGHDWATSLSLFTSMHWRRKWQPTPVFLPGESQGRGSLVGCRLWRRTESDMTESDLAAAATAAAQQDKGKNAARAVRTILD